MNLQTLLGDVPKTDFVRDCFHRLPFASSGTARELCPLAAWDAVAELIGQAGVDLMVVREGRRYAGSEPATKQAAEKLVAEGYTILIRHAERWLASLETLAKAFERDFQAPVNIHVYATPAGQRGFGWHYDAEDVFIVQTAGAKEYSLRKNTVNPWPLEETLPRDMRYEREIMLMSRVLLTPGDWLYIPCGYWHRADAAEGETAVSIALGVMSPAAIEVYDFVRSGLLDSLLWRQRLPVRGAAAALSAEELAAAHRELFLQLGEDLRRRFSDEGLLRAFLDRPRGDA